MADQMKPTPRGFISGLFSDVLGRTLNMPSMPRTGIPALDLFYANRNSLFNAAGVGDVQKTAERISYGQPLTTGSGMTLRPREEAINAAMTVIPLVGQGGRVANQAAMTAGRAGARYAERVVPQVMERGGLPAQLLGDISRGSVSPLDVYHGTPHTLPPTERNPLGEFDASKIGTGEGAQAYGYGIYTAEAPTVAKEYQQKLSSVASAKNLASQYGGIDEGLAEAMRRVENYKQLIADGGGGAMERVKSLLQISEKNVEDLTRMKAGLPENTGNLYKVDLPDEKIATMLDWDKPVSQQKNVIDALRNEAEQRVKSNLLVNIENDIRSQLPAQDIGNDYMALFGDQNIAVNQDIRQQALAKLNQLDLQPLVEQELNSFKTPDMTWDMSGNELYKLLSTRSGSQQQASNLLQSQGIAGIKYLDEGSRNLSNTWIVKHPRGGENVFSNKESAEAFLKRDPDSTLIEPKVTRNFVVFPNEEKSMTILERNGMPATPIESPTFTDPFGNTIGSSIR